MFFAVECRNCGKFNRQIVTKKTIKRKMKKVSNISTKIGKLMLLTLNTKKAVYTYSECEFIGV